MYRLLIQLEIGDPPYGLMKAWDTDRGNLSRKQIGSSYRNQMDSFKFQGKKCSGRLYTANTHVSKLFF